MMRSCAPKALLYTEMITAQALVLGQVRKPLEFDDIERPLVCQLGGSDPDLLSQACQITNHYHFEEINLNAGCPSPKVSQCDMGAKLMDDILFILQTQYENESLLHYAIEYYAHY